MQKAKQLLAKWHTDPQTGFEYRYIISQSERLVEHYHDYYEIFIVTDGNVYHTVNGIKTLLEKGDLYSSEHETHIFYHTITVIHFALQIWHLRRKFARNFLLISRAVVIHRHCYL